MSRCILFYKGIFDPCRICKTKYQKGLTACYCTKNFFQVVVENLKNKFKKNKIVNIVGACTYDRDEYKKVHNRMMEELARDYAERNECSTVSVFENGKFTRNVIVEN